ncbi:MAG: hypothetical protein QM811_03495 [Pirellulales bacterium]
MRFLVRFVLPFLLCLIWFVPTSNVHAQTLETEEKNDPFANPKPRRVDPNFDPFNPPALTPEERRFWENLKEIAHSHSIKPIYPAKDAGKDAATHEISLRFFKADPKQDIGQRTVRLEDLRELPKLKFVTGIGFGYNEFELTDEWLPIVAEFKNLESIFLGIEAEYDEDKYKRLKITSAGIAALKALPVRSAYLRNCVKIDDEAMRTVGGWKQLRELNIHHVPITDHGVFALRGCGELRNWKSAARDRASLPRLSARSWIIFHDSND